MKDGIFFKQKTFEEAFNLLLFKEKLLPKSVMIMVKYLDPKFHPNQSDIDNLAKDIIDRWEINKNPHLRESVIKGTEQKR